MECENHNDLVVVRSSHHFERASLTTIEVGERLLWPAQQVGQALGYADQNRLANLVGHEWSSELEEGTDYVVFKGAELAAVKAAAPALVDARAPALLMLTESGVNLVAILSRQPAARRLRRWLASEVLPSLRRTGSYTLPSAASPATVSALADALVTRVPPTLRAAPLDEVAELLAAEEASGRPLNALRGALEDRARRTGRRPVVAKPDAARAALVDLVAWATAQQARFYGRQRGSAPPVWLGRWDPEPGWTELAIMVSEVRAHLALRGLGPNQVLKAWAERGWLLTGDSNHRTLHRQIGGAKARCCVFPRAVVENAVVEVSP